MNKEMDIKLARLKSQKQSKIESEFIKESLDCKEHLSGLIVKTGTRVLKSDDLTIAMKRREFVPIESID